MIKRLVIENDPSLRLVVNIKLNNMILSIEKKFESLEVGEVYKKEYTIDMDSKLDLIFEEFYIEYLKLKDIELYWKESLKEGEIIKFNIEEVED